MQKFVTLGVVATLSAFGHASFYQYDDGIQESQLSTSGPPTYNAIFLTHYVVAAGGEVLTSIDLVWGSVLTPNLPNGLNADVLLMSDPNGDGNPNDAAILQSIATTTVNSGTNIFNNFSLTGSTYSPGTSFFAGAFLHDVPNNSSWVGLDSNATGKAVENWWNVAIASPIGTHNSLGVFGNPDFTFLVRVNASPVPEPASLIVLGGAVVGLLRRRSVRKS